MPRFTVIGIYYQGVHTDEIFARGMRSLWAQTFGDVELLIYHDGPLLREVPLIDGRRAEVRCTEKRFNDWGHTLRDRGIWEGKGDYLLFFNMDNVLYPECLEELEKLSRRPSLMADKVGKIVDKDDILIFPILYRDFTKVGIWARRMEPGSGVDFLMTGVPPAHGWIDCMQMVAKREIWQRMGGWHLKDKNSDAYLYVPMCERFGYRTASKVLGEHW